MLTTAWALLKKYAAAILAEPLQREEEFQGRLYRVCLALAIAAALHLDAYAQSSESPRSDSSYRTAWPKQVPVLKPDPVLGDAKIWELWVYDHSFAERFEGFDPQKANAELNAGVYAIAFRTYKRKIFDPVPDMFVCEYNIYFDGRIRIPLSDRDQSLTYPPGITFTFHGLRPVRAQDVSALSEARSIGKAAKSKPLIFADGKLDDRYADFALDYVPDLVPGMSMVALRGGDHTCKVLGPKRPGSHFWFWLFGELSYNSEGSSEVHRYSERFRRWMRSGTFDAGPAEQALANGHVRMPEAFYEAVLSKVTLIKAINQCIAHRSGYERGTIKDVSGRKKQRLLACDSIEREGKIFDFISGTRTDGGAVLQGWNRLGF